MNNFTSNIREYSRTGMVTTSSTAVLTNETKLVVGEILELKLSIFNSKLVINEPSYTIAIGYCRLLQN